MLRPAREVKREMILKKMFSETTATFVTMFLLFSNQGKNDFLQLNSRFEAMQEICIEDWPLALANLHYFCVYCQSKESKKRQVLEVEEDLLCC